MSTQTVYQTDGFTLTEALITVVIIGILSSVALPNYSKHLERTKQNGMAAAMEQILVRVVNFKEEIGLSPTTWNELNNQMAIMTTTGPASGNNGELDQSIKLLGNEYEIRRTNSKTNNEYYIFTANNTRNSTRNVIGCIDLSTGASDVKLGIIDTTSKEAAKESDLVCK